MADPGVSIVIAIVVIVVRVAIRLAVRKGNEQTFTTGPELDDATRRMLASPSMDARAETRALANSDEAGTVLLFDVDDELTVDGGARITFPAHVEPKAEVPGGYRQAVAGRTGRIVAIMRLPPGRHSLVVRGGGRIVSTAVFLHPKETWARRVAPGEGDWEEATPAEIERARSGIVAGTTKVVDFVEGVLPGIHAVIAVEIRVKRTITLFAKMAASLSNAAEVSRLCNEMKTELDGAGLSVARTEMLVSGFGNVIWETRSKGENALARAIALTELALTIVPDEPRLLALLGETEKALGRNEHARAHLERALARGRALGPASLDATWTARVEAALA